MTLGNIRSPYARNALVTFGSQSCDPWVNASISGHHEETQMKILWHQTRVWKSYPAQKGRTSLIIAKRTTLIHFSWWNSACVCLGFSHIQRSLPLQTVLSTQEHVGEKPSMWPAAYAKVSTLYGPTMNEGVSIVSCWNNHRLWERFTTRVTHGTLG